MGIGYSALEGFTCPIFRGWPPPPPAWWSAPFNLMRIPLAWYLAFGLGWGPAGVWWAINLTTYAKAAGLWWKLRRGRWPRLRVYTSESR